MRGLGKRIGEAENFQISGMDRFNKNAEMTELKSVQVLQN
jgi:hypothetical protein